MKGQSQSPREIIVIFRVSLPGARRSSTRRNFSVDYNLCKVDIVIGQPWDSPWRDSLAYSLCQNNKILFYFTYHVLTFSHDIIMYRENIVIIEKNYDEISMKISVFHFPKPKNVVYTACLHVCMLLLSLCGFKAGAKSNGPILITFSKNLYFRLK